ncbi:multicomponent Na+:H+ antiporter subunit F [Paenibacillus phyllosphaerae]|uniref:Multicomponent Na+:H+ antiporter subunit F n=1 Tax=Paenibacillus phyllosphaerae TaxID=274593 RepID=A0A7W5FQP0_9BACL|nr:Na(+)/H(+) antiporter subunit F1 [Paenibacillus phyllosphaerae]MBB3113442.1 multicomponent Na+:H+ antiporter subunit F [Paenibacillus phyllosphaerae]
MMDTWLILSLAVLSLSILGCMYRLLKGPSISDRIAALDTIGIVLLAMITIVCAWLRTTTYMDIVLLIGILTFIGTIAFARYLERGEVL